MGEMTKMDVPAVSVICCYTSVEKLAYLSSSLDEQTLQCERVFVDNSENRFASAASALNHGAQRAHGDLLLFCHQDVRFKTPGALAELVRCCAALRDGDVGGVAGAVDHAKKINITHSVGMEPYEEEYRYEGECVDVMTIDECVIILPRATWEGHHFDEEICDSWHFYGVEQSLFAINNGHSVKVFDADVNHLSYRGTNDRAYYRALRRVTAAYRDDFELVSTTTGFWPTKAGSLEVAILRKKWRNLRRVTRERLASGRR